MTTKINGTNTAASPAITGADTDTGVSFASDTVNISTGGTTRATVDSSGNLGIGTTSPAQKLDVTSTNNIAYALDGWALAGKGDSSDILFGGILGSQFDTLKCYTSGSERMRIDSSGNLTFSLEDSSNYPVQKIKWSNDSTTTNGFYIAQHSDRSGRIWHEQGLELVFGTTNAERMRIDSNGRVGINNNAPAYKFDISITGEVASRIVQQTNNQGDDHALMLCKHAAARSGSNGVDFLFHNNGDSVVGKIDHGQSSTQYRTSSDYRLKENATAISDGITRLKTLKPYQFNWIAEKGTPKVDGFFAHEVTAVPEAISGTKDEVDSDNKPVYQSIDHSKLVPLLTAALQEAVAKIEVLETKVAALEAA